MPDPLPEATSDDDPGAPGRAGAGADPGRWPPRCATTGW